MEQATRSRFLDLVAEGVQALLDYEGPQFTGGLCVHVNVRDGVPDSATVGAQREGD
jgi:hypothetical protein